MIKALETLHYFPQAHIELLAQPTHSLATASTYIKDSP